MAEDAADPAAEEIQQKDQVPEAAPVVWAPSKALEDSLYPLVMTDIVTVRYGKLPIDSGFTDLPIKKGWFSIAMLAITRG